jgi:hypothetical protein
LITLSLLARAVKDAIEAVHWAYANSRLTGELLLVLAVVFIGWRYNIQEEKLSQAMSEHGQLEDGLKQEIRMRDGQIEILKREGSKTTVERVYVPPEGSVAIKIKDLADLQAKYKNLLLALSSATTIEDRDKLQAEINRLLASINNPGTDIIIKDSGFTFKPGLGVEYAGVGLVPRLDAKLYYFKRYSLLMGGSRNGIDVSISRHLDDILWGNPTNLEVYLGYKFLRMYGASMVAFGLRMNF